LEETQATNLEANPEMMQSEVEHREVPTEEATVKSLGTMKKQQHGLASCCRATQKANGTDLRRLWILKEVGCRLQEGVPSCSSGMAQEKLLQENSGPGKLWTAEGIGRSQHEDDPQYKSGTAQGT
jgi:hypothetical protein